MHLLCTTTHTHTHTPELTKARKVQELLPEAEREASISAQGVWRNWRRECLTGVNSDKRSQLFNKTKWLPLAQSAPFAISHQCCSVMKKSPAQSYQRKTGLKPILGTMASEGRMRKQAWLRKGCNGFDSSKPTSQPLSFWTDQDVLEYIVRFDIDIASIYGQVYVADYKGRNVEISGCKGCKLATTGCDRSGCVYCAFGLHLEKDITRFQRLQYTHPKLYEYSIYGGQWVDNPNYDATLPKNISLNDDLGWNPQKIWVPSKKGLGLGVMFDTCNEIYGKDFIRYI